MTHRYDVYGVGNAIVDTEAQVDDAVIDGHGLQKGTMKLVSSEQQAGMLAGLDGRPLHRAPGGSAANTMVGVAHLGGRAYFAGKVGADAPGRAYREGLAEVGVDFDTAPVDGEDTGACLVLVTPDGERTMQTSLGAAARLAGADVDAEAVAASRFAYVEGYLFSGPDTLEAAERTMAAGAASDATLVAVSLSDPAMVTYFIDPIREAVARYADVLFCNEQEAALFAGGGSREELVRAMGEQARLVFMTCGGDGALVCDGGEVAHVPGHAVPVVDTTGAGDAFAAGALVGLSRGMSPADAARIGSFVAASVVARMGPRLDGPPAATVEEMIAGARPLG